MALIPNPNRKIRKGQSFGRMLKDRFKLIDGKLYQLHATKGWRRI